MTSVTPNAAERLATIKQRIEHASKRFDTEKHNITLVAVSKTFPAEDITPSITAGQKIFGENRVQEAKSKWPDLKEKYPDIELHLIGPLQTNKAREAIALFDVIETVDREKLAAVLKNEMERAGKRLPCYVQVNIGAEEQKAGIMPDQTVGFIAACRDIYNLDIVGLMCIPPADKPPGPYFAQLAQLAQEAGVSNLSMGMSGDFETAIAMGATHVRVGSALFGSRS